MTDALAQGLADTLMRAAQDHVAKAQQMLDQTKALVEIIHTQVAAQAKQNEDMNARFKQVGERMLDVHRILNGEPDPRLPGYTVAMEERKGAPVSDLARRGSGAGAGLPSNRQGGLGTLDPALTRDPKRDPDANYPARTPGGLPHALAELDKFRAIRADPREDHRDPGIGSKQPDRD